MALQARFHKSTAVAVAVYPRVNVKIDESCGGGITHLSDPSRSKANYKTDDYVTAGRLGPRKLSQHVLNVSNGIAPKQPTRRKSEP
jgi:hypothetical protein